jgi:hypothetical protein
MPVPTLLSELSVTPSLNSPQGTESAKGTIDDYLRAHAAFIRQTSDLVLGATVTLPSASTVAIGFAASFNINITGTTTINSFDNWPEGALRYVTFSGAMTLAYSAAMALPTTANITTVSGDSALFKSLGGGNWKCLIYQRLSGLGLTQASTSTNGYLTAADWNTFNGKQAALGFTPYNSTNPAGYITATALSPYMPLAGGAFTGRTVASGNVTGDSAMATATTSLGEFEIKGNGTGAAMMTFHRPNSYASYLGLDTDNVWKVGGYSAGAVAHTLFHSGNLTNLSQLSNDPGYLPAATAASTYLPLAGGTLTGPLKLPDGSQGAPSLSWSGSGDTDTGFFHIGDGLIGIVCNGVLVGRFTSSGLEVIKVTQTAP